MSFLYYLFDSFYKVVRLVADKRFDVVDQRLLSIEELTKRTAMRDVKYLKHKVSQIEQDVFPLNADD